MARRITTQLAYRAIRIEGGLIPADELTHLTTLQAPDKTEQTDGHYGVPKGLKLRDEVARYWKIAQTLWTDFQFLRARQDVDAHQVTVRDFLVPLLRDVLGFVDLSDGASVDTSGHTYNIGYVARKGQLPVVLSAHTHLLDAPAERFGEFNPNSGKIRRRSPFMLAQEALNASDDSLWAITSNGLILRILRDNPSLTRPAYVEVDLEASSLRSCTRISLHSGCWRTPVDLESRMPSLLIARGSAGVPPGKRRALPSAATCAIKWQMLCARSAPAFLAIRTTENCGWHCRMLPPTREQD